MTLLTVVQRAGVTALALILLAGFTPSGAAAQSIWGGVPPGRGASIEVSKVAFSEDQGLSTFSLAYYFGARFPIRRDLQIVGELPFATAKTSNTPFSRQAIGNPYVGVEWEQSETVVWEAGLRLPLSDNPAFNNASILGLASDAADRLEAWFDRALSIQVAPNLIHRNRDGLVLRVRAGPSLFIPMGGARGNTELIVAYAGQVGYEGDLVQLLGGVSGRTITTGEALTYNHAVLNVAFDLGGFRPAAFVRVPFGDLKGVAAVYGIVFTFG
ncbi:MAG: hypothetical protein ACC682_16105 [Gemmatimonadota bacterium]